MEFKLYEAVARTGNKKAELDWEAAFYKILDGVHLIVAEPICKDMGYSIIGGVTPEDAVKWKEAVYIAEQDEFFGVYFNDRKGFDAAWDAGEYETDGMLTIQAEDIEIIREL